MNHHHRKILHSLFAHPVNANIRFRDVEHLFKDLGAVLSHNHAGRLHVELNGRSANFSTASHTLPKAEVMAMRKFLEACGIEPARDYPIA